MAVFTKLSFEEAAAFVNTLGLKPLKSIEAYSGRTENTNYIINTEDDEYVLTLFERRSFEQLFFYLHLMTHLADRGIPVPRPVANNNGDILYTLKEKPAAVVNKLRGASEMAPTLAHCHVVADMLARMHLAGADYDRFQPNPCGLVWWNATVPSILPRVAASERSLISDELSLQNHIAASRTYEELPRGVVHADLFRDNVMFEDGQLSGFSDFYFGGVDTFVYDIGVCLNDWCVHPATGRDDPDSISTFLTAYQAVRKCTPQEIQLLPAIRRAAALSFWLSRLHNLHLPRKVGVLNAKDSLHFQRILRALRSAYSLD